MAKSLINRPAFAQRQKNNGMLESSILQEWLLAFASLPLTRNGWSVWIDLASADGLACSTETKNCLCAEAAYHRRCRCFLVSIAVGMVRAQVRIYLFLPNHVTHSAISAAVQAFLTIFCRDS